MGGVRAERALCSIYFFGTPVKSAIARNYRSFNRAGGLHGFHGLDFFIFSFGIRASVFAYGYAETSPDYKGNQSLRKGA
jgi:hypothetical protein